jgi:hypothetical protein
MPEQYYYAIIIRTNYMDSTVPLLYVAAEDRQRYKAALEVATGSEESEREQIQQQQEQAQQRSSTSYATSPEWNESMDHCQNQFRIVKITMMMITTSIPNGYYCYKHEQE